MEVILKEKIEAEARRRIAKWRKDVADKRKRFDRFQKKTGSAGPFAPSEMPSLWIQFNQFNPYYCIKHSKYLAKVLVRKVRDGSYETHPSIRHELTKPGGGVREVDAFGIPDSALCTYLSAALRERNDRIFSAYSYAYRPGLKPIDAINRLYSFIKSEKVFVSNYDFKNYFGSVRHEYIGREILNSRKFKITSFEKNVLRAVMRHEYIIRDGSRHRRSVGFPQGNSLSLFFANSVGDHLDRALDKANGNYIRYADDSIVVTYSYEDSVRAISAYSDFSKETGVKINSNKESGISIVSDRVSEMRTSRSVDFLGYSVSKNNIAMSGRSVSKLKSRCAKIIYRNLLMFPRRFGCISKGRISRFGVDWDLLACVTELRLMLYGEMTQVKLERYLIGRSRVKSMSSGISYYCLTEKVEQFSKLDGWLVWAIVRALTERYKFPISGAIPRSPSVPTGSALIDGSWLRSHRRFDGRIPSFVLAWRASKKAWFSYGNLGVDPGREAYDGGQ